ncbi:MAG TPA: hypothetical protein VKR22_16035 [Acidimicrobiales bacterium]|nr:hypothetical protein [Acidimicrobiales bacterium]
MTSLIGAGGAAADTSPGQGSSYAQLLQVTPHEGSLAVGAVFGEALAGHTNTFARAQSQGLDLGAVGESARQYNCGSAPQQAVYDAVPDPLQTETGAPGAAQGQTDSPSKSDYFSTEFVKADSTPYGEADTTFGGPVADPTNAFTVSGMHSKSWSGVVNGVNEAGATADIASLDIAGTVHLDGLHWETLDPTGGTPTGSFSIGHVTIAGTTLPTSNDLSAVQNAVNQAIGAIGLQMQLPKLVVSQGVASVPPLEIDVVPNATRDGVLDPIITNPSVQGNVFQITNGLENGFSSDNPPLNSLGQTESGANGQQLAQALCQSDTAITILDVTVAAFDGGGYFNTAFGGVNASSGPLPPNSYDLAALGFGSLDTPGSSQFTPGDAGIPGTAGLGTSLPASSASAPSSPLAAGAAPVRARRGILLSGTAGPLLAVGLAGLGLLGLLAEADRRKMRRAQRTITFDQ